MNTITPAIKDFFDRYAQGRTAQDIDVIASQYPDEFMTAGPNGVRVAQKAAVVAGFTNGREFLKTLGHESTEVLSLDESRIDEHYVLVRASFVWRFRRASMPSAEAKVDSTFILYFDEDAPRIVFQHEHHEFLQALRAGGVLESTAVGAVTEPDRSAGYEPTRPEMVKVKYEDLSYAFDFVSGAAPSENNAWLSLETGAIYFSSEIDALDDEDLPDDLETSDLYLAIPHKNDLDLGNNLVFRFVRERLPHRYEEVRGFFRRRGAYARFKEFLVEEESLEEWYAFEAESTTRALREWCEENGIYFDESDS